MTTSQQDILTVLRRYGPLPDHALVPLAQHVAVVHQSSSGIRSRRHELAVAGLVESVDEIRMPSGRNAVVWGVVGA